jgi:starch-binding outer membrane protein, SusD/RagB family
MTAYTSFKSLGIGAAALLALGACDATHPLSVADPDVANPNATTGPNSLPVYRAGSESDFAIIFIGGGDVSNGGHEGIANFGGLFTDEMDDIETFPTRTVMNDRDAQSTNGSLAGVFQDFGQAHNDNERAFAEFAQYSPTAPGYAEIEALDGYLYVLVAEHWCSGEPWSLINVQTGAVVNSAYLTTDQMLDTALVRFQKAKQIAATSDTASAAVLYAELAQIGAARALFDLGQVQAAADSAAAFSDAKFNYTINGSTNSLRQNSGIWYYNVNFPSFSMGASKNTTGLPFATSGDPRTPATLGKAAGGEPGAFYISTYYTQGGASSVTTLASYTEAQLMVAEGDIFAGNYAGALTIMQALRAGSGLDWTSSDTAETNLHNLGGGTAKQQMQQLLSERAYWMWVTGHRLGDWRRMLRAPYNAAPFSFATGDVYPTGGGLFNILEFPTPLLTNPNPNYKACNPDIP